MSKKYGVTFIAYKCLFCDGWHIAKDAERVADKTSVKGGKFQNVSRRNPSL